MNKIQDYYASIEYDIEQKKRNDIKKLIKYIEKLEKEYIKSELQGKEYE